MTLLELIERLIPYFPKLPPEVAEFFGEVLLTGDPGQVDTHDLRMIMYALPFPENRGEKSYRRHSYQYAAINLLNAINEPWHAELHYLKFAKKNLDTLSAS